MTEAQMQAYLERKQAKRSKNIKHLINKGHLSSRLRKGLKLKEGELISDKLPQELKKLKKKVLATIPEPSYRKLAHGTATRIVTREHEAESIARVMLGDSHAQVERRMNIATGYVARAMAMRFPDRKIADEVLEDVLLNNAHLASAIFATKARELSAKDAAVAAGIFSQRYIEKKAERTQRDNPIVPVNVILQLNSTLKKIEGKTLDANTHKELEDS